MIVIRSATIMDGPVVRWFHDMSGARTSSALISASRNGVHAHGFIDHELFDKAWEIHERLKRDNQASTADVVTHVKNLFGSAITPIVESEDGGE
jgi:hypothetical protein